MRRNFVNVMMGVFVAAVFGLAGCGGGGGGSSTPATATGKFIDAPVSGMTYESGAQKGTTGADGSFTYETGKNVKFSIGDIVIGDAPAQGIMTPVNLAAAGSDASTPEVVARVQLLMSLSSTDPTTTGVITITPAILTAALNKAMNFTSATLQADLGTLVTSLGKTLVTQAAAQTHLTGNINKMFQGNYSGTWASTSGPSYSGTWTLAIDANGNVTGTGTETAHAGGSTAVTGNMLTQIQSGSKYIFGGTAANGYIWTGTLDVSTGTFSGTAQRQSDGSNVSMTGGGASGGGSGGGSTTTAITATATTTAQSLTVGTAMTSFSPLTASGGTTPYTYSHTGTLPTGLSFSTSTGAVTGTPTAAYATANLIFSVRDANNNYASTTSTVSFTVSAASGLPTGYVSQGGLTWTPDNIGQGATYASQYPTYHFFTWPEAYAYCAGTSFLGQTGWRLPTHLELSALYTSGAMNGQGWTLFDTWSSAVYSMGSPGHRTVYLLTGWVGWNYDTNFDYVSCVR